MFNKLWGKGGLMQLHPLPVGGSLGPVRHREAAGAPSLVVASRRTDSPVRLAPGASSSGSLDGSNEMLLISLGPLNARPQLVATWEVWP